MMMTNIQAWLLLVALVVPSLVVVFELRAAWRHPESRVHAHSDGTIHSHGFGRWSHFHPRRVARYRAWLVRVWGPEPEDVDGRHLTLSVPPERVAH